MDVILINVLVVSTLSEPYVHIQFISSNSPKKVATWPAYKVNRHYVSSIDIIRIIYIDIYIYIYEPLLL